MGKFLGIEYDHWHFVIPVLVLCILMPVGALFVKNPQTIAPVWLILSGTLFLLQYLNELIQRNDPKVIEKYGSFENFLKNSKRDWKLFIIGWVCGSLGGAFLSILILKFSFQSLRGF